MELASHLHRVLTGDYRTVCAGIKHEVYTQVAFSSLTLPQRYMIEQVATERNLVVSWECRDGDDIATFCARPVRNSFADLLQHELDTCFEVVFGADALAEAQEHGGVRVVWNHCLSTGQLSTQLLGRVASCELMLSVGSDKSVQVWADMGGRIMAAPPINLFGFVEHMKSINLDFNF